jgi:hypothetical protein
MSDFDNFDWNAMKGNAVQNVKKTFEADTRYWKVSQGENGVGSALIRLLPDPKNVPFVQRYEYALKKSIPGAKAKWYIANDRTTIDLADPAKEYYDSLKREGTKEADEAAKGYQRATKFITNILVVNDPANPENNNKVFLFKMGSKLKSKIEGWMEPDANEISMGTVPKSFYNPLASGRDIMIKVKPLGGIPNYDDSEYRDPRPVFNDKESAVAFIQSACYDLQENVLSEKEFEPYETLKDRFNKFNASVAPVAAPVAPTPVPAPVAAPVAQPVYEAPVAAPVAAPVYVAPTAAPVAQPVYTAPVVAPVATPVYEAPVAAPVAAPVYIAPTVAPVAAPVAQPVAQPVVAADDWLSEIE